MIPSDGEVFGEVWGMIVSTQIPPHQVFGCSGDQMYAKTGS